MSAWPPEDAGSLIAAWKAGESPEIPLGPGVIITDLEKWLDPMVFRAQSEEELDLVRQFVLNLGGEMRRLL